MKTYHSRAYHRFFEGYSEKQTIDEKGNPKIIHVYTADYYEPSMTRDQWIKDKIIAVVLMVLAAVLFAIGGTINIPANAQAGVAVFEAAEIIFLFWLARSILYCFTARCPYTIRIYKIVSEKLIRNARRAAVCCWLTGAAMIVYTGLFMINGIGADVTGTLLSIVVEIMSGLMLYIIYHQANRIEFKQRKEYENEKNSCGSKCREDHDTCGDFSTGAVH